MSLFALLFTLLTSFAGSTAQTATCVSPLGDVGGLPGGAAVTACASVVATPQPADVGGLPGG